MYIVLALILAAHVMLGIGWIVAEIRGTAPRDEGGPVSGWCDSDPKPNIQAQPGKGTPMDDMKLPEGMTCGDCVHAYRCTIFGFTDSKENTTCDFSPSRFRPANPPAPEA